MEAKTKFINSSMVADKVTVGEFSAIISQRAKLVRKRGGTADQVEMITLLLNGLLPEFKTFKNTALTKSVKKLDWNT